MPRLCDWCGRFMLPTSDENRTLPSEEVEMDESEMGVESPQKVWRIHASCWDDVSQHLMDREQ